VLAAHFVYYFLLRHTIIIIIINNNGRLGWPQSQYERCRKQKNAVPCRDSNTE